MRYRQSTFQNDSLFQIYVFPIAASSHNISLLKLQQSSFQSDIESINSSLEEERARNESLQDEITVAKCKLEEDMFRTRSSLLMDIISMQLFYAVRDVSLDDASILPENELIPMNLKDDFVHPGTTKGKILENIDLLLELFKGYLNMMNSKGEKMLENSGSLRFSGESEEVFEERTLLLDTEDLSLYITNKTDDDKVVASTRCLETLFESRDEDIPSNEEKPRDTDGEYPSLTDKLVSLKSSIDNEALDFLKRAFEFDVEINDQPMRTRKDFYERIKELLQRRESVIGM